MIGVLNTRPKASDNAPSAHDAHSDDVTRTVAPSTLTAALTEAGFDAMEVPLVELVLLHDALDLMAKLSDRHYDGILLSSPNLLPLLKAAGRDIPPLWCTKPWYLIGPRARLEVEALGVRVAFVPREEASLEGFLREVPTQNNLRLIHPCSTKTRLEPTLFTHKGIDVHNMAVYEPRCPAGAAARVEAAWPRLHPQGAVLFASGSAVHHFFEAVPKLARTLADADGPVPISIGASTTRALRMYGLDRESSRIREAPTADTAGFITVLEDLFPRMVDGSRGSGENKQLPR
jgi:uroporphyrinogen-III synthase